MPHRISRLVSVIRASSVRDKHYYAAEQQLIAIGQDAMPALQELAQGSDPVAAERAKEILKKIVPP